MSFFWCAQPRSIARLPKCASDKKYIIVYKCIALRAFIALRAVYIAARCLEKAEFEFGFFGHHVFGPFGFEDDGDVDIFDALDRAHFLADIFDDEVACGA